MSASNGRRNHGEAGNDFFQQALRDNLDLLRNRLHNGSTPDASSVPIFTDYSMGVGRPAKKQQGDRKPSSTQGKHDLSVWLEKVYGASSLTTKSTRVRPTSASAAARVRLNYNDTRNAATSLKFSPYMAAPMAAPSDSSHSSHQHMAREAGPRRARPSSAMGALSSASRSAGGGKKEPRRTKPATKRGMGLSGSNGKSASQRAAERERQWAEDAGIFDFEDLDDSQLVQGDDLMHMDSASPLHPESDLSDIYEDEDEGEDIFDCDFLHDPQPPDRATNRHPRGRVERPSAAFLRPQFVRPEPWAGTDDGDEELLSEHGAGLGDCDGYGPGRAGMVRSWEERGVRDSVNRDLLMSSQAPRHSLHADSQGHPGGNFANGDGGHPGDRGGGFSRLRDCENEPISACKTVHAPNARDPGHAPGVDGIVPAGIWEGANALWPSASQGWRQSRSHGSDDGDPREPTQSQHRIEYNPEQWRRGDHAGAALLEEQRAAVQSSAGGERALVRPQTAPTRRVAIASFVSKGAEGRLHVAPEVDSPRKKTTIRLTATGCFRNPNRPTNASSRVRPNSAGAGGARGIPGLTRPWSGKQRWVSDKRYAPSEKEDAMSLAVRRKRGDGQKVFILSGPFKEVREALLRRGWCENSTKESNLFDLKWTLYDADVGYASLRTHQIVNHFQGNAEITAKGPLCRNMRSSWWVTDVDPDVLFPRSFNVFADTEWEAFLQSFYLTAAQGLLAMFVARRDNGTMHLWTLASQRILRTAAGVSEHRALRLRRTDVEHRNLEWVSLPPADPDAGGRPKSAYKGSHGTDSAGGVEHMAGVVGLEALDRMLDLFYEVRDAVRRSNAPRLWREPLQPSVEALAESEGAEAGVLEDKCREILQELSTLDPQLHMSGCQNVWIIKASNSSKGLGIKLFDKLSQVSDCKGTTRVLQKYIERPLLVNKRKFDLRCWVLVTDWNPLTIWFYDECIARFCSDAWDLSHIGNRFAHLANVSVNKDNFSGKDHGGQEQVWSSGSLASHLATLTGRQHVWSQEVQPKIKQLVTVALRSAQNEIKNRKSSFELYGFDVVLDDRLEPWLLEINLSPDLRGTTPVKAAVSHALVEDMLTLTLDLGLDVLHKIPPVGVSGTFEEQWHLILQTLSSIGVQLLQHPPHPQAVSLKRPAQSEQSVENEKENAGENIADRSEGDPSDSGIAGPVPLPNSEPGRWCCIYKDAEETEANERSDLQFELQGHKISPKELRALESHLDSIFACSQAVVIQRRSRTFVATCSFKRKRRVACAMQAFLRRIHASRHFVASCCAAALLQAHVRQRRDDGKFNTSVRANQIQRAWQVHVGRRLLATRRSAALRMQAWLRMCLCRTFFRKVVQYADYAHDELLKALDGDQRMQAGQGEYLGTPFAFLWMRLGALPGGSVRRVGMQGKSSQETWRRQCLEAFLMYRAGGSKAIHVVQQAARAYISRCRMDRRRCAVIVGKAVLSSVFRRRYVLEVTTVYLQAVLRRLRCCGTRGSKDMLQGIDNEHSSGAISKSDDLTLYKRRAGTAALELDKATRKELSQMSSLVEVSPDSSVCTSSTVTPCMTPDSPVDHLFKQAYLPVEMQRQVRSVRLMKMETITGDGGLEIDDESAEEYSFDLEAEEEEGEEMRDIEKDGSLRNLDAVRNDQEKEKMRSSVRCNSALSDIHIVKDLDYRSENCSEDFFYVMSATFASRFSLPKWRESVQTVVPRIRMRSSRALFLSARSSALVLASAVRRKQAIVSGRVVYEATAVLKKHANCSRMRQRYLQERVSYTAALCICAATQRVTLQARYLRLVSGRILLRACQRAHSQRTSRLMLAQYCLSMLIVAQCKAKHGNLLYLKSKAAAYVLQAGVRRMRASMCKHEFGHHMNAEVSDVAHLQCEQAQEGQRDREEATALLRERQFAAAQLVLRGSWLAHKARACAMREREIASSIGRARMRQRRFNRLRLPEVGLSDGNNQNVAASEGGTAGAHGAVRTSKEAWGVENKDKGGAGIFGGGVGMQLLRALSGGSGGGVDSARWNCKEIWERTEHNERLSQERQAVQDASAAARNEVDASFRYFLARRLADTELAAKGERDAWANEVLQERPESARMGDGWSGGQTPRSHIRVRLAQLAAAHSSPLEPRNPGLHANSVRNRHFSTSGHSDPSTPSEPSEPEGAGGLAGRPYSTNLTTTSETVDVHHSPSPPPMPVSQGMHRARTGGRMVVVDADRGQMLASTRFDHVSGVSSSRSRAEGRGGVKKISHPKQRPASVKALSQKGLGGADGERRDFQDALQVLANEMIQDVGTARVRRSPLTARSPSSTSPPYPLSPTNLSPHAALPPGRGVGSVRKLGSPSSMITGGKPHGYIDGDDDGDDCLMYSPPGSSSAAAGSSDIMRRRGMGQEIRRKEFWDPDGRKGRERDRDRPEGAGPYSILGAARATSAKYAKRGNWVAHDEIVGAGSVSALRPSSGKPVRSTRLTRERKASAGGLWFPTQVGDLGRHRRAEEEEVDSEGIGRALEHEGGLREREQREKRSGWATERENMPKKKAEREWDYSSHYSQQSSQRHPPSASAATATAPSSVLKSPYLQTAALVAKGNKRT